jgi:hypothetical protein|tara:strand:- start:48 stop:443 length:396 start_codon:yes stop_codon:yes gene_type:complete
MLAPKLVDIIGKIVPDPEAKAKAEYELLKMAQDGEFKAVEQQMSAILAEAKSSDAWTSRARPSFLYLMYLVIVSTFVGGIVGIWHPEEVTTAAQNIANLLAAIPETLWWMFGTGYLGYTGARSFDKMKLGK